MLYFLVDDENVKFVFSYQTLVVEFKSFLNVSFLLWHHTQNLKTVIIYITVLLHGTDTVMVGTIMVPVP